MYDYGQGEETMSVKGGVAKKVSRTWISEVEGLIIPVKRLRMPRKVVEAPIAGYSKS